MRTTLTLDDDVARELKNEERRTGRTFREVVNDALRRGLAAGAKPRRRPPRFVVKPRACGFQPGIDLLKLNQLNDELEIEAFARKARSGA